MTEFPLAKKGTSYFEEKIWFALPHCCIAFLRVFEKDLLAACTQSALSGKVQPWVFDVLLGYLVGGSTHTQPHVWTVFLEYQKGVISQLQTMDSSWT